MPKLTFSAGTDTEDLAEYLLADIDDAELDEIEVDRDYASTAGMANEPVTVAIALVVAPILAAKFGRLAEQWMEQRRQERELKLLIEVSKESPETAELLENLMERHADISVAFAESGSGEDTAPVAP